jgi:15-hydroxyprostaglandin dehydrogenase (NAD)
MAQRKVAIITGAASGIGLALARHLLSRGYRVVIADINEERGKSIQEELGPSTHFICCDVSNWESSAAMFKSAYEWGGRIDFFAANAGISEREPFYTLPEELREPDLGTMEVDFNSVAYGLRLFRHYVREGATGEGGKMVVSSSMAGFYPMYLAPMYGAAKHAVSLVYRIRLSQR